MSEKPSRLKRLLSDSTGFVKEVLMIIVGISIALWVDQWQNQVKNEQALLNIYGMLEDDLQDDTTDMGEIVRDYTAEASIYARMLADGYTKEELAVCDSCQQLMTSYTFLTLEIKGLQALKSFNYDNSTDTLPNYIISALTAIHDAKDLYFSHIMEDSEENTKFWRDNFDWFADYYWDRPNEGFIAFLHSDQRHKNRLTYHASLVFDNYLPFLELAHEEYGKMLSALNAKLAENGMSADHRQSD